MMRNTRSPARGEPGGPDGAPGLGALAALWSLALERFRDYLHWASDLTAGPRPDLGGSNDIDR